MRALLRIGLLSGLAAGTTLAACLATFGRAPLRDALALEHNSTHDRGTAVHDELFSRGVQEIGGAIGLIVFGVALGVIFTIVLGVVAQHLSGRSAVAGAAQFALIGFVAVVLVPFLKYPGNPPGVGNPDTVNERTLQYFAVLAFSIVLVLFVWQVRRRSQLGPAPLAWLTVGIYGCGLLAIFLGFPANPDPVAISADLVWRFRLSSLGGLASGWTVMALTAGTLLGRLDRHRDGQPVTFG